MGILFAIVLILVLSFMISFSSMKKTNEENTSKFSKLGYNYIGSLHVNYKGGIKNISINNVVLIYLLQEGLSFKTNTVEKLILFKNITDISLQNQQYIQSQISLGKLIIFGVLALGMDKKQNNINDEYIVLKINDEDGEYNVLIQAYELKNNQDVINNIIMHKNNNF